VVGFLRFLGGFAFVGAALAAFNGCGMGGSDDIARGDFEAQLVHATCDTAVPCCDQAALGYDPPTCRTAVLNDFGNKIRNAALGYDADAASTCIDAYRQLASKCQAPQYAFCAGVFPGQVPLGGPCNSPAECDPGPNGFATCSVDHICIQPPRGAANMPCSFTCRVYDGRSDCTTPYASAGNVQTVCFENDGLICYLPPGGQGQATCQPVQIDCRQRIDKTTACGPGTYCDEDTGACAQEIPLGGNCAVAKCTDDTFCFNGVCQPRAPVAAPCSDNPQCLSGRCSAGYCRELSPAAAVMCKGGNTAG
jgi:hypothetical protein